MVMSMHVELASRAAVGSRSDALHIAIFGVPGCPFALGAGWKCRPPGSAHVDTDRQAVQDAIFERPVEDAVQHWRDGPVPPV